MTALSAPGRATILSQRSRVERFEPVNFLAWERIPNRPWANPVRRDSNWNKNGRACFSTPFIPSQ